MGIMAHHLTEASSSVSLYPRDQLGSVTQLICVKRDVKHQLKTWFHVQLGLCMQHAAIIAGIPTINHN